MCDRPGPCYQYGEIIILSRVLCNISAGDTLTVQKKSGTIYVIKNEANILPYCVINKHQGNSSNTANQQPNIIPAHVSSGMSARTRSLGGQQGGIYNNSSINQHQAKGNGRNTANQQPNIIPAPAHSFSGMLASARVLGGQQGGIYNDSSLMTPAEKQVLAQFSSSLAPLTPAQQQNVRTMLMHFGRGQGGKESIH